jgi:hypothetical protein
MSISSQLDNRQGAWFNPGRIDADYQAPGRVRRNGGNEIDGNGRRGRQDSRHRARAGLRGHQDGEDQECPNWPAHPGSSSSPAEDAERRCVWNRPMKTSTGPNGPRAVLFASRSARSLPCRLLQKCSIVCPIVCFQESWCQINREYMTTLCTTSERRK